MISHSYPSYNNNVAKSAFEMLQKGNFSARSKTIEAESALSQFTKTVHTKLVSSGFTAIQCALIGAGIKQGEEIIIPNITCPSVYQAVKSIGAVPKVVEVGENVPLLSDQELTKEKKGFYGVIPNMFGISAPINAVGNHSGILIEDNAQYFTSKRAEWADTTVFSFSPTKLMTIGYGGAIQTNDEKKLKRINNFLDCDYVNSLYFEDDFPFRIHSEISDFQSAMLIEQLKRYEEIIQYRHQIQQIYDLIINKKRLMPEVPFRYQIILENPNSVEISNKLQQRGISAVPLGSHLLHEVFSIKGNFSNSEWWKKHTLSLPIHEAITKDQAIFIANEVKSIL